MKNKKFKIDESRELDAWIANYVFNLPVDFEAGRREHGPGYLWFIEGNRVKGVPNQCEKVKHYSTDPAAAMEVLRACLSSDKLTMPIEFDRKRHKAGRFRVETGLMSNPTLAIEDTLELSICQFAKQLFTK